MELAIGSLSAVHVDVRIRHFFASGAVADDQWQHVLGGVVDEPMGVARTSGKASAHPRCQHLAAGVGFELYGAVQHLDEFILTQVGMPVR